MLALDDALEVAGPVLSRSEALDEETLVEGARTKSQGHLLAISRRRSIGEGVTDVLVERGNREVVVSAARNAGARFSDYGASALAARSQDDGELARHVWSRPDIPRQHLLSLFAGASEVVREQLEAADRPKAELYRYMVVEAASQVQTRVRENSARYEAARAHVESLHRSGELAERHLLAFALAGLFDEVTIALSLMCDFPIGQIERAMVHDHADQILVLAKATGLSWETTKAILQMSSPARSGAGRELEAYCASFTKLQPKTARAAMQFYRLRARAVGPMVNR
jgi:uncharacterized protein (DUF2336 family)